MDESIDVPIENTRYVLPDQTPRTEKPVIDVPVPDSNKYDDIIINGEAIDKLIRQARDLLRVYRDISMSPEWPRVVELLRDWRELLRDSDNVEAIYWLRQISKILPNRNRRII